MTKHRILLFPTPGIVKADSGEMVPTENGYKKIKVAVSEARKGTVSIILVVGGKRKRCSEASVYASILEEELRGYYVLVVQDAQANLTNRDLWKFVKSGKMDLFLGISPEKRSEILIEVLAYRQFYNRIEIILRHLGFTSTRWLDSGEASPYSPFQEDLLLFATKVDPFFLWSPPGLLFVLMSEGSRRKQ